MRNPTRVACLHCVQTSITFESLQGRFFFNDAALHLTVARLLCPLVLLHDIETLHNHPILFG